MIVENEEREHHDHAREHDDRGLELFDFQRVIRHLEAHHFLFFFIDPKV
jgi:hypothetical protein